MDKLTEILDKVITYTDSSMPIGRLTFAEQKPLCYPVMPPTKSAEEMLRKALEFANQGMDENVRTDQWNTDDYSEGKYYAYEDVAEHLEMLIKEAKRNG